MTAVMENAEIITTANAEAKNKTAIRADKLDQVDVYTVIVLEGMTGNFKLRNFNLCNKLVNRDCLDIIKYQLDENDKISVIANKNVAMFMRKSVEKHILQMIEGSTAYDT